MKLSICIITYNHALFIGTAIESVLIQKTNFDFQIVIGEDCSTDNTLEICKEYASKYPDKITLLPSDKNRGMLPNFLRTLDACDGQYVALLEGDDYWTDETKAQQQINFLDQNLDFTICFHNTLEQHEDKSKENYLYVNQAERDVFEQRDLFKLMNFIPTCSVIFRNKHIKTFPSWFTELGMGDWSIHILNSENGKIKYINKTMGVHRLHSGGIWTGSKGLSNHLHVLNALNVFMVQYGNLYPTEISASIATITKHIFEVYLAEKEYKKSFQYYCIWFQHTPIRTLQNWKMLVKLFLLSSIQF